MKSVFYLSKIIYSDTGGQKVIIARKKSKAGKWIGDIRK